MRGWRTWWCDRYGHRRVADGDMVRCTRCGNVRARHPKPGTWTMMGEEFADDTDPDPDEWGTRPVRRGGR
jgi:hypothetical protein